MSPRTKKVKAVIQPGAAVFPKPIEPPSRAQLRGRHLPPTRSGMATLAEMTEEQVGALALGDEALSTRHGLVRLDRSEGRVWGELGHELPVRLMFAMVGERELSFCCADLVVVVLDEPSAEGSV